MKSKYQFNHRADLIIKGNGPRHNAMTKSLAGTCITEQQLLMISQMYLMDKALNNQNSNVVELSMSLNITKCSLSFTCIFLTNISFSVRLRYSKL